MMGCDGSLVVISQLQTTGLSQFVTNRNSLFKSKHVV